MRNFWGKFWGKKKEFFKVFSLSYELLKGNYQSYLGKVNLRLSLLFSIHFFHSYFIFEVKYLFNQHAKYIFIESHTMFQYRCKLCNVQIKVNVSVFWNIYLFYSRNTKITFFCLLKNYTTSAGEIDGLVSKLLTAQAWESKFGSPHPWRSQSVAEIGGSMKLTGMST